MPDSPLDHFRALFQGSEDPWHTRTTWYELRKRRLLLAALPQERYQSAYEPACSNGELTAALAERCDHVLASDGVAAAVELAQRRVHALPNVEVVQAHTPQQWPDGSYDLVVLGEFVYYLEREEVSTMCRCIRNTLTGNRTVLACHWHHPISDARIDATQAHELLSDRLGLRNALSWRGDDFLLDVWTDAPLPGR